MKTNKDFNIEIFEAIRLEAQNYFNEIKEHFEPGTYHANDLTKLIAGLSKKLQYKEVTRTYNGSCRYRKKDLFLVSAKDINNRSHEATFLNSGKQISIEVDSFKVSFDACKVFDYLTKFARVNGIRENILFTNEVKTDKDPLITFDIDIQKDALDLCKYVLNDDLRPTLNHIYISLEYFTLVATNGHILGEKRANISNLKGEGIPRNLLITSEALKKCAGPCKVSYYGDRTIIENSKGEQYITKISGDFPNYKSVIPTVLDSAIVPVDYNQIKKFLTTAKKNKSIYRFMMEGKAGENKITLSTCEDLWEGENKRSIIVDLKENINFSFCIAYNIENFLKLGKFESIYLSTYTRASVLNLSFGYALLMPLTEENAYIEANCEYIVHPFYSSSYVPCEPVANELEEDIFSTVVAVEKEEEKTIQEVATVIEEDKKEPSYIIVSKQTEKMNYRPRLILSHRRKEPTIKPYIDQVCILSSQNSYIAANTIKNRGELRSSKQINNNFGRVPLLPSRMIRKYRLYEARSG